MALTGPPPDPKLNRTVSPNVLLGRHSHTVPVRSRRAGPSMYVTMLPGGMGTVTQIRQFGFLRMLASSRWLFSLFGQSLRGPPCINST